MATVNNWQAFVPQGHNPVTSMISPLPSRPQPTGSDGTCERLYTNHFRCSFDANRILYQYDVSIEGISSRSNSWLEVKGRVRCAVIMQLLISSGQFDPEVIVWYDEHKCLYSTSHLSSPQIIFSEDGRSQLKINSLANQWSTNDIKDYIDGRTTSYPYDAIRILETLLKRSIQDRVQVVNNICYFLDKPPTPLPHGFEQREGFFQALHLSSEKLTLNVQTKSTIFYQEMSLLDFITEQIGQNRIPSQNDYNKLSRMLEDCQVVTQQSNWTQAYTIDRFDWRRPQQISIGTGESLIEYYRNAKNIELHYTDYQCLQVYSVKNPREPCHLPVEVCRIKSWQVYNKPISKGQSRKNILTPTERYWAIRRTLTTCSYNSDQNRLCREVKFHIDDSEMLAIDARILKQPEIHTGSNYQAEIYIGRMFLNGHLFTPKPISTLAIAYFGSYFINKENVMSRFRKDLLAVMNNHRIHVDVVIPPEQCNSRPDADSINQFFCSMLEQQCELVVCVMDGRSDDELTQLKAWIKNCGTIKHGVMTQCVRLSKINHNRSITGYCESLLLKINFKNAGINTKLDLEVTLKKEKSEIDSFMFFGADVIHPVNVTRQHPSIVAVVGSGDSLCSTTAARVCQQYPKEGKCSMEIIIGMKEMVEELLEYNRQVNNVLPKKVVFYRDGIDDGQFSKVLAHEIPAIRGAFNTIYGDATNHPLLTFIVVKKRHNTRFFTYNEKTGETKNMSIGSVIDTTIVHPYQYDFYLNSHNAIQGVNRPSLYHVLLDEIGLTTNELQLLTYHLCFTDPRSSAAEAIPSVVHQADVAALKARDMFYDDERSSTTSNSGRSQPLQNPVMDDLSYEMLNVHENLKDRSVFS